MERGPVGRSPGHVAFEIGVVRLLRWATLGNAHWRPNGVDYRQCLAVEDLLMLTCTLHLQGRGRAGIVRPKQARTGQMLPDSSISYHNAETGH